MLIPTSQLGIRPDAPRPAHDPPRPPADLRARSRWAPVAAPRTPSDLVLYSGQHEQTTALLVGGVRKADRDQGAEPLGRRGGAGQPDRCRRARTRPADVFYSGEHARARSARRSKGMLAPVAPATLAAVPAATARRRGCWVGVSARVSALVYNTAKLGRRRCRARSSNWPARSGRGSSASRPRRPTSSRSLTAIIKLTGRPPPNAG